MLNDGMELEIIINPKTTDDGHAIIQLETAAGAAIKHFKNAHGINVPRKRFLPVKSCSDLLLIKSDIYSLQHGQLVINEQRMFETTPVIKLGDHFKKVPYPFFWMGFMLMFMVLCRSNSSRRGSRRFLRFWNLII
jgi:UTP--glucose-1-phosphate uridylyltransferase